MRPAGQNAAAVYLARLAPSSRATMRWALRAISLALGGPRDPLAMDWARLSYPQVVVVRAALVERYPPATARRMLSALRGVLHEAWRLGQIDAERYQRSVDVPAVRGRGAPAGRALGEGELARLLATCSGDGSPRGLRDAAIVALLAAGGLRRAELVALDLADYDPVTGAVVVREGKGRKGRVSYAADARGYMAAWLDARGAAPGPLFLPARGRGSGWYWRHLSGEALRLILQRRAGEAGVAHFTPHDLRRTWVGRLLDAGADLVTTQVLAGHADPKTTAGYDRRSERARQRAAALLHLPQVGGTDHGGDLAVGGSAVDEG